MKRTTLAIAAAVVISGGTVSVPTTADAYCYGCGVGAGVAAGIIGGAIIGGAIANSQPRYYGPGPYYPGPHITHLHRVMQLLTACSGSGPMIPIAALILDLTVCVIHAHEE